MINKLIAYYRRIAQEKREYRQMEARAKALPEEYWYVYHKIQHYMWSYTAGSGMDMVQILSDLVVLFEEGVSNGKHVLQITGDDVAAFCDELLKNAKTYTAHTHEALNRDIMKKLGKRNG